MCACPSSEVCDVEDRTERVQTHINQLPVEILREILSYLSLRQLFLVQSVSRLWRDTAALLMSKVQQFGVRIVRPVIDYEMYNQSGKCIYYHLEDTSLGAVLKKMKALKCLRITVTSEGCSDRMDVLESPTSMVANIYPKRIEVYGGKRNEFQRLLRKRLNLEVANLQSTGYNDISMRFSRHTTTVDRNTRRSELLNMLPDTLERLGVLANCLQSQDVAKLGEFCPNLVDVDVTGMYHVNSLDFRSMLAGLPRLRTLSTMGDCLDYDISLDIVNDQLTELAVYDLTDDILQRIVNRLPHLTSLRLGRYNVQKRHERDAPTEGGCIQIAQLKHLNKLTFDDNILLSSLVLDALHALPITELHLCRGFAFSENGLARFIVGSHQLKVMGFRDAKEATADMFEYMADRISPSCWMEIRDNKSDRLLAILPETRSNTARRILVIVDEHWYNYVGDDYW